MVDAERSASVVMSQQQQQQQRLHCSFFQRRQEYQLVINIPNNKSSVIMSLSLSKSTSCIVLLVLQCSILLVFATASTRRDNNNEFFVSLGQWHGGGKGDQHQQRASHHRSIIDVSAFQGQQEQLQLLPELENSKRFFDMKRHNPLSMGRNFAGSLLARAVQRQRCNNRRISINDITTATSCSRGPSSISNGVILASSSSASSLSAPTSRQFGQNIFRFLGGRKRTTIRRQQQQQQAEPSQAINSGNNNGIVVETFVEEATDPLVLKAITQPIIPQDIWERLTGREFQEHPELVDDLANLGENFARNDAPNDWVDWQPNGDTLKGDLYEGDIHVWTGKCKSSSSSSKDKQGYGTSVPWIKTRSIVPMPPQEMAELLLDSSRVKNYNAWSTGRQDMWRTDDGWTKIVKNKTQPPVVGAKAVVGVTLLHARPLLHEPGSWLVVSRAVGGTRFFDINGYEKGSGKSEILLGVNLLQAVDGDTDSSILTAVTHAYSAGVPTMLAERLGVKSAIKFVKDMRALKQPEYSI
jgi:hypothetical protein